MVCSNCKHLLIKQAIRYSHLTKGNIRTCPQIGGFLYVVPVYTSKLFQFNDNLLISISSYLTYFDTYTKLPLISKQFDNVKQKIVTFKHFKSKSSQIKAKKKKLAAMISDWEYNISSITFKNIMCVKKINYDIKKILYN